MVNHRHRWLCARYDADRRREAAGLAGLPPVLATVDAHRRLRGPYTAAGALLRELVPVALERWLELVARHDVELLTASPELRTVVPATRETLTSLAVPAERTRFYSRLRTLRIAHGLTEFLRDHLRRLDTGPRTVVVHNAHEADRTDRELLAVLLRRMDPAVLTIVVTTGTGPLVEPPEPIEVPLEPALVAYAERIEGTAAERIEGTAAERIEGTAAERPAVVAGSDVAALAQRYVDTDCTSDDPALVAAYQRLDPDERARLHDARAAALQARDEPSLGLGAIPYHAEHGTDPGGAGVRALRKAIEYCVDTGFYHATVDFGARGRAVVDWKAERGNWWAFTTKMTTSFGILGHPDEAIALYDEARAATTAPFIHMQAAYGTAMMYTRHLDPARRDHVRARAWSNLSIAIASLLPDEGDREFSTAFNRNGLALIEVHDGHLDEALRLVNKCIDRLDEVLRPDEHTLHRSVLVYNRGQVYAALRRFDEALADYTAVMALDPNYPEYHFDRGNILRRLGRNDEALADYERALELSPPFPEVYYNRGDVRLELGDVEGALADFSYVIELEPSYVDSYVNRAGLLCDLGEHAAAARDVATGLDLDPDNAHLLTLRGRLLAEAKEVEAAHEALSAAIAADPALAAAWATRGVLRYEAGDLAAALADLDRAMELTDDAGIRFNRAVVLEETGRYAEAIAEYDTLQAEADDPDARERRAACERHADGRADLDPLRRVAPGS